MNEKFVFSFSLLGVLGACGGSPYPDHYSEADKACFDYGKNACDWVQDYCDWLKDGADTESYPEEETDLEMEVASCLVSDDEANEAYLSGAVYGGCDLATFSRYWIRDENCDLPDE